VWAYGRGQTDRHTDTQKHVTTIHFASTTTHAKCNNEEMTARHEFGNAAMSAFQSVVVGLRQTGDVSAISKRIEREIDASTE